MITPAWKNHLGVFAEAVEVLHLLLGVSSTWGIMHMKDFKQLRSPRSTITVKHPDGFTKDETCQLAVS